MKSKDLRGPFLDFAATKARRSAKGSYAAHALKVASNWLRFNSVGAPGGIKVQATSFERKRARLSERAKAPGRFASVEESVQQLLSQLEIPRVLP